ncbi:MAG: hypothetical protein DRI46_12300 [Chloroflexi bacterium]|nr:MAG: hypothetical protein DRI46_12300 [Chloroflexota bacterium]
MNENAILEEELYEAKLAKRIRNDFLGDFFRDKEQQIFDLIKALPIGSGDDLINAHHQLKSLNALQQEIQSVENTGKMAEVALKQALDKADK